MLVRIPSLESLELARSEQEIGVRHLTTRPHGRVQIIPSLAVPNPERDDPWFIELVPQRIDLAPETIKPLFHRTLGADHVFEPLAIWLGCITTARNQSQGCKKDQRGYASK